MNETISISTRASILNFQKVPCKLFSNKFLLTKLYVTGRC